MTDAELLARYARSGEQGAFAEPVRRHVDWVHSAAARQVGGGGGADAHGDADDVIQAVFLLLARRARELAGRREVNLAGWLFRATRYAAGHVRRAQARRARHERRAATMMPAAAAPRWAAAASADVPRWEELAPALDELIARLPAGDRQAVLLRFYGRKSMADVGAALGVSEEAAKKRVAKAIGRLRDLFARRGVAVPAAAAALAAALFDNTTHAAPPATAARATSWGSGATTMPPAAVDALTRATSAAMASARLKLAAAVGAALVACLAGALALTRVYSTGGGRGGAAPASAVMKWGWTGSDAGNAGAPARRGRIAYWIPLGRLIVRSDAAQGQVTVIVTDLQGTFPISRIMAASATPSAVDEAARREGYGDLYFPDRQTVVPLRGTRLAPLTDLPRVAGGVEPPENWSALGAAEREADAGAVARHVSAAADADRPRRVEEGQWYGVIRPTGDVLIFVVVRDPEGLAVLRVSPIGTAPTAGETGGGAKALPPTTKRL